MARQKIKLAILLVALAGAGYLVADIGRSPGLEFIAGKGGEWLSRAGVEKWIGRAGTAVSAASIGELSRSVVHPRTGARGRDDRPAYWHELTARGDVLAVVAATGSLTPVATVAVGTEVSGQIREIFADFNDEVRKGAPIALIDPVSFEIALDQARADLDVAIAAVATQRSTNERIAAALDTAHFDHEAAQANAEGARVRAEEAASEARRRHAAARSISAAERERADADHEAALANHRSMVAVEGAREAQVRQAEADLRAARSQLDNLEAVVRQREAALRHAQIQLERTIIRSPIEGMVVDRAIEVGQTVAAALEAPTLFTIAQDLRDMQVDAAVDESEIGLIAPGQRVEFMVDAYPDRRFEGTVAQVRKSPQTVQNVVTYTVVVKAPNADLLLLPGMTASARFIVAQSTDVVTVPNAALRFRPPDVAAPAGSLVWVEDEGSLRPLPVRIGLTDGTETEISGEGVVEGLRVVTGIERPREEPSMARRLIGVF